MNVQYGDYKSQFLSGGGEMGALIRAKDWSKTPLGSHENWPQSLLTTLSIILNSRFPMFLWWGPDLICFYNDAYRPSLGENGKHPDILGEPAIAAWPEIWDIIKPLIDNVLTNGEATWSEDQLIPIYRNGKIEDVYWTFSYSPVKDESGKPAGVFVTCSETTAKVMTLQKLNESKEQLQFAIDATELGTWDYNPATNMFSANQRLKNWFGLPPGNKIELGHAINVLAEKDRQRVIDAMKISLDFSSGGVYDIEFAIVHPATGEEKFVHAKGKAWFSADKTPYRFNGTLQDITAETISRGKIEVSHQRFQHLIKEAPVGIIVVTGHDMVVEIVNQAFTKLIYHSYDELLGKPLFDIVPESAPYFLSLFRKVRNTNDPLYLFGQPYYVLKNGVGQEGYLNLVYQPYNDINGNLTGVMLLCQDVTAQVLANQKIKESEERLSVLIEASELGTFELNIKTDEVHYSDRLTEIFGYEKGNHFTHVTMLDHLHSDDKKTRDHAYQESYRTGTLQYESRIILNDDLIRWIEVKGKVFYDDREQPAKLIGTVRDTTDEKYYQQELERREQRFRLLADCMPQLIWTGDAKGRLNYFNKAVYEYSGLDYEAIEKDGWLQIVHPDDLQENLRNWKHSLDTGDDFFTEHRFRRADGVYRWQLSRAIAQKDLTGAVQLWVGTSTDIEDQKVFSQELEKEVRERTRELEFKNIDLENMNKELESFAYIASHDLQEPLRKIQTYVSFILDKDFDQLSERGRSYFERMQNSALRMQQLIEDLLTYSRTNNAERDFKHTDLSVMIEQVKADLKEEIQSRKASIETNLACHAHIIRFQFRQLMQNLISNSLKFTKPGEAPHITIISDTVSGLQHNGVKLPAAQPYCHIRLSDNGIGFEPQYSDRIFELFQRLHGKNEYKGTGIGLAIVKKIVDNHNGFIIATGQPAIGATFDIYFPLEVVSA